jgi:hypothetical protein
MPYNQVSTHFSLSKSLIFALYVFDFVRASSFVFGDDFLDLIVVWMLISLLLLDYLYFEFA